MITAMLPKIATIFPRCVPNRFDARIEDPIACDAQAARNTNAETSALGCASPSAMNEMMANTTNGPGI